MQKKNFKRHCAGSSGHKDAIDRQAKRRRVEEIQQQQYAELFNANPIPLIAPSVPCQPPKPPSVIPSYIEENAAAFDNKWDALTPDEIDNLYPVAATKEEVRQTTLNREIEHFVEDMLYEEVYSQDELSVDVDKTDQIADDLQGMGLSNKEEALQKILVSISPNDDFYPYPNLTVCYLDIFNNFYRQRHSEGVIKSVLWLLKNTGAKDVPSYKEFRKIQQEI
ncbi:hypothetical protein V5O48_015339 [Marasmius crinis-equi]|uniref:Uncharacterized protein n=1 Tax=Marasmius crinis-equi TaxID=585013 RepID=A0ABR3EUT7_9AGAR